MLYLRSSWGQPAGYGGLQDAPLLRLSSALEQGVWLWVLFAGLQLGLGLGRLSRKEANWLAPLGVGPGTYLLSLWLGTCAAAALATTLLFGALIATDTIPAPDHSIDRVISWKSDAVLPPGQALNHEFDPGDSGRFSILVRPTVGASPTTDALVFLTRGSAVEQAEARILGLRWLGVPIPTGSGEVRMTLANQGDGYLGVLGSRSLLTLSAQSGIQHWLGMGLRAWLHGCLLLALLITACTWLRPTLGIPLALLTGWIVGGLQPTWLAAWPESLAWQRVAVGAPGLTVAHGLFALLTLALCWGVARRGLQAWGIDR
ncbi:MAG: hypothetical protein P1V35_15490 [Planctomycetota bacterium]|nr:hypothetical protein [Planctomycetota bacterium]